jgi:hypothetical protein
MVNQSPDTAPEVEKVQIELIRAASVAKRISLALSLSETAMFLSRRAIQRANPSFSRRQLDLAFVAHHYGQNLAERLRLYLEREQL